MEYQLLHNGNGGYYPSKTELAEHVASCMIRPICPGQKFGPGLYHSYLGRGGGDFWYIKVAGPLPWEEALKLLASPREEEIVMAAYSNIGSLKVVHVESPFALDGVSMEWAYREYLEGLAKKVDVEKVRRRCRDLLNKTSNPCKVLEVAGILGVKID